MSVRWHVLAWQAAALLATPYWQFLSLLFWLPGSLGSCFPRWFGSCLLCFPLSPTVKLDAMSCRSAWMLALLLPQLLPKDPVLMMISCLVQLSLQLGCCSWYPDLPMLFHLLWMSVK